MDTTPNCGNILAGVGPFALERGLFPARDPETPIRVRTLNTGTLAELVVSTPGGRVQYAGAERIDGVPGLLLPSPLTFLTPKGRFAVLCFPQGRFVTGSRASPLH